MKIIRSFFITMLLIITIMGCSMKLDNTKTSTMTNTSKEINQSMDSSPEPQNTIEPTQTPLPTNIQELSDTNKPDDIVINIEDFNVNYKGFVINDVVPLQQIADDMGLIIGKIDSNIELRANCKDGNWYIVHYPNKEAEELRIDYIVNKTLKTQYLVYAELYKVCTNRGVYVGDDIEKVLHAYGDFVKPRRGSSTTDWFYYKLGNEIEGTASDKSISIITVKNTNKVIRITIDYNLNKAMKEIGIAAFD